ncbi:MAG: type I-C CRISPR-associated protein Cas7/Csd2 [Verrucomicrobia bacterium]|nr:type I-C CRISPR-associated protein Cas7/Csd2 [Verrucomicrobiota bacterium]MCH8513505.1 type I-C CRISPR-associated protein Cas7/Csd2 [Kiritimatiellia bacterium]
MSIKHKYDFAVILSVINANPNGDPLNGNRPRTNYEGLGEISDVCIKRKIRNRLMQKDENILVQSDDNSVDDCKSIKGRIDASGLDTKKETFKKDACSKWFDVRAFGQIFPFKGKSSGDGVSIPVRGPVTVQSAFSLEPVSVSSNQITKSTNLEDSKGGKRGSDTMGMKHRVDRGIYVFKGSINAQLASDETGTGFTDEDADKIKSVLTSLFENDASSARPDGTMEVKKVIWWKHSCPSGDYSSAKVHRSLSVKPDGTYTLSNLEGLIPQELDGF